MREGLWKERAHSECEREPASSSESSDAAGVGSSEPVSVVSPSSMSAWGINGAAALR